MSNTNDFLYTNRFTNKDVPKIDYTDTEKERKKAQFSDYHEGKYGMPLNLLDDQDINPRYSLQDVINTNMYRGGYSGGGGGGGTLRYQKIRKKIIAIDSRDRDTSIYPNPNKYRVFFGEKFVNIKTVRLVSTEFPNTEQVIRSQPPNKKNNKIYWKNEPDGDDINTPRTIYSITITDGNYSSSRFANELKSKMNAVSRSSVAPEGSRTKPHDFIVSVNTTTNVFEISQNDSFTISNPFSATRDSGLISVSHSSHGFTTGQVINVSDSAKVGGIPFNIINSSHIITVPSGLVDFIAEDSTSNGTTIVRTGLVDGSALAGTVSTTLNSRIVNGFGTNFTSLSNGTAIHIGNHAYNIKTVHNDIQLTLFQESLEDINGTFIIEDIKQGTGNELIVRSKQHGFSTPDPINNYPSSTITITGTGKYDGSFTVRSIVDSDEFNIQGTYTSDYIRDTYSNGKYTYNIQNNSNSAVINSTEYLSRNYFLSKKITGRFSRDINNTSRLIGSSTRYEQDIFEAPARFKTANSFESSSTILGSVSNAAVTYYSQTGNTSLFFTNPIHNNPPYSLAGKPVTSPPNEIVYKLKLKDIVLPSYTTTSANEIVTRLFFCTSPNYAVSNNSLEFEAPSIKIEQDKTYKFDLSDESFKDKMIYFSNNLDGELNGNFSYTTGVTESANNIANINLQPGLPGAFKQLNVDFQTSNKLYYYVQSRGLITGMVDSGNGKTIVYTQNNHGIENHDNSAYGGTAHFYLTAQNGIQINPYDDTYSGFIKNGDNSIIINQSYVSVNDIKYWHFRHAGYKLFTGENTTEKGNFTKVTSDTSYLGNANYGFNTVNLSASNETVFLSGNVINIMSDGSNSWNGVGKATFWAPNHGLSASTNKIAIFNSKISSLSNTEYYGRQGTNSVLGNMYDSNITSISVGGTGNDANDIIITVNNNINDSGGAHMITNSNDFVIVKGYGSQSYDNLNGLYRVNKIDNNQFKIRKSGINSINSNSITSNAANIRFYGIGYNGEYEVESVTNDTFTINYPYMGSENADWGEVLSANNGYKVYPVNPSSINVLGSKFTTELAVGDNLTLGDDKNATKQYLIQSITNDNSLIFNEAIDDKTDVVAYKNLVDHGLNNNDNLSFLRDDTNSSTDWTGNFNITKVNHFEFTINETRDQLKIGTSNDGYNYNLDRRWIDINKWNHNSKYNFTVNRTATETVNNRGGDAVKIGIAVRFSLQFSYTDTPGKLLGFPNVGERYKGLIDNTSGKERYYGDTEYNAVQSNTVKADIVNILSSTPGSGNYDGFTLITTQSTHQFETGDRIFIENHSGSSNDLAINDDGGHIIVRPDNFTSFYIQIPITVSGGATGIVYRKQLFKPYSLSGENYVYLKIPTLSSISSTSTNVSSIFAKILLDAAPGSILFNSYVSSDKVFEDVPLNELDHLDIEIVDPQGELFEFNNIDHSLSLEITSYVDIVKGSGVSSRTGQTDET